MPLPFDPKLISTTDQIAGYEITASLGVVEGITTSSMLGGFFERPILEQAMREAFLDMMSSAAAHGAQAIVSFRYSILDRGLVLAYGTAVKIKRL